MNKNSVSRTLSYYKKGPNQLENIKMNSMELRAFLYENKLITCTAKASESEYNFPSFTKIIQDHIKTHGGMFPTQEQFIEGCCFSSEYKDALKRFEEKQHPIHPNDDSIQAEKERNYLRDKVGDFDIEYKIRCARSYLSLARDEELCLALKERFPYKHGENTTVYYNNTMDENGIDIAVIHTSTSEDGRTTKNIAILNTMDTKSAIENFKSKYETLNLNEDYTQIIINLISNKNMEDGKMTFYPSEAVDEIEKIIRDERGVTKPIIIIDGKISNETIENLFNRYDNQVNKDSEKNEERDADIKKSKEIEGEQHSFDMDL